jgi:hypothetical protein
MRRQMLAAFALTAFAPLAHAQQSRDITGSWTGGYVCAQGVTALRLTITRKAGDAVAATFSFGPRAENPGVPKGSYEMRGSYDAKAGHLKLDGVRWIDAPSGYVMVGLEGWLRGSGIYISGDVAGPGCAHFDITRDNDLVG